MRASWGGRAVSSAAVLAALVAGAGASADPNRDRPWPAEWPIILPPVAVRPPLPPPAPPEPPATQSAERIVSVLRHLRANARDTRYEHRLRVNERTGTYHWDCSLMTTWVLTRAAPRAVRGLGPRPLAAHYARVIERAPMRGYRQGWQRIEHIRDVRPGDVFAWRRPPGFPSRNTGHVGFALEAPRPVPGLPNGWAVRIADATSVGHQNDTRLYPGPGGFGIGTVVFLADAQGRGTHYGWGGTYSQGYVITPILFGRVGP